MAGHSNKQQSLNSHLYIAAMNGLFIQAKNWVRKGAQVDEPNDQFFGWTPIMAAIMANPWTKGHYDIVNLLLKNGANPNQTFKIDGKITQTHPDLKSFKRFHGMSLLTRAACQGHLGVLQLLVKHGADVNQKTGDNYGPLDCIIDSPTLIPSLRLQLIEFFLKNGVVTEYKDKTEKLSPFHRAVEDGQIEVVKLLIQHGVNMESRNSWDNTPIITCTAGRTCTEGHLEIVKLLLEQGIDINSKGAHGYTMLHFAVEDFNFEFVKFLLDNGANVNAKTGKHNTPLHSACNGSDHHLKRNKVTEMLLEHGADISAINKAGCTPLHLASEYGLNLAVQSFLKKGAKVDACADETNMRGHTPLVCAAEKGHLYIVKMLINKGANVNFKDITNVTALHGAAYFGHVEVCEFLIKKTEADLEAKDTENRTPLHYAVAGDCAKENDFQAFQTVESLLKNGAKVNVDSFYGTPLDCANALAFQMVKCPKETPTRVQKLLKNHGAIPGSRNVCCIECEFEAFLKL